MTHEQTAVFHSIDVYSVPFRGMLFKNDVNKKWTAPFLGSDKSVVYRSQRYNYSERGEKPVSCGHKKILLTTDFLEMLVNMLF